MEEECQQACKFYDSLANRIPPKFYFEREEAINMTGMKKKEKLKLQKQFQKLRIQNKKNKQNPELAKTTLQLQEEELKNNQKLKEKGILNEMEEGGNFEGAKIQVEGNVDREELERRLADKLHVFKSVRNAVDVRKQTNLNQAKEFKKKQRQKSAERLQKKRKLEEMSRQNLQGGDQDDDNVDEDIVFSKVGLGSANSELAENNNQRKKGKFQMKKEMLQELEKKKDHLNQIRNTAEEQELLIKEGWQASLQRAQGDKVYDDPKLLKRSLKSVTKRKAKSAKAWSDRIKTQQKQMETRQNRRAENINSKIQAKKQKRTQKRENRLMRAGFEGRREEFIRGGQ